MQILPDYLWNLLKLRALLYIGALDRELWQVALEVELDDERAPGLGLADYLQVPARNVAPRTHSILVFGHQVLDRLV